MSNILKPRQISITLQEDSDYALQVEIMTPRLTLSSVQKARDQQAYERLFTDPVPCQTFGEGKPLSVERINAMLDKWSSRWQQGCPYSAFAVFNRQTGQFAGHLVLGYSVDAGYCELTYIFHPQFWGRGLGTEAVSAAVNYYLPLLADKGYPLGQYPLAGVRATVRVDNAPSRRILQKTGIVCRNHSTIYVHQGERYLHQSSIEHLLTLRSNQYARDFTSQSLSAILSRYSLTTARNEPAVYDDELQSSVEAINRMIKPNS